MTRPNILDTFQVHRQMSKISGIWPNDNSNTSYKLRTFTTWFLSIGVTICMMIEAVSDIKDVTKLSQIIYIMISWIAYIMKLAAFTYNTKTMLTIFVYLNDPIFMSFPKDLDYILSKAIKFSTVLANIIRIVYVSCPVLYLVYPILDNLPLPFPFPYDLGKYRYFMYAFQVAGETCAGWNSSCLDTLCTGLIAMATVQLDILAEKLVNLNEEKVYETDSCGKSNRKIQNYMKQCIEHHLAIIKLVQLIKDVFTVGLFVQLFASIVVICNTAFQFMWVTLSWEFFLLSVYFLGISLQLFMYCWYGNELILSSLKVADACYMSKWYEFDNEIGKYLFIIMERCKRPLKISTMKFSVLSLSSFGAIVHWSYSVLTLLINMYKKKELQ